MSPPRAVVAGLCLVSGLCGLTYQVLWVRQLGLVLGITSYAVATVLAAFMGGLAFGSVLFGRRAERSPDLLRLYGLLELGLGASALALPWALDLLVSGYAAVYEPLSAHPLLFALLRSVALLLLLGVPCTFMGGTLPVLVRLVVRKADRVGTDVGWLYGLNTLGAVLGCLLAGFVLLAQLGLARTGQLAAAVNLGLALFILLWRLRARRLAGTAGKPAAHAAVAATEAAPVPEPDTAAAPAANPFASLALVVMAVSGFCALGYEVLWSRILAFFLHNSTYAFSSMLACFLLGIGLGSLLPRRLIDHSRHPARLLAASQVGIGLLTLLAVWIYPSVPVLVEMVTSRVAIDAWWKAVTLQGALAALLLVPATFFMGFAFPVAVRLYAPSSRAVGRDVGTLYAVNTVFAILGSVLTAFWLVPAFGLELSFRMLISLNLTAGLLVVLGSPDSSRVLRWATLPAVLLLSWMAGQALPETLFRDAFRQGETLLFYEDGAADTVMVRAPPASPADRWLVFSDGRGTAGTGTNAMNRLYGHLPLLLHGSAERVLSITFGTGNTLAAMVLHPEVEQIDAVELSPDVLAAARFFPTNDRVWEHPKLELHVEDGRNWLLGTRRSYDVIQLEPPEIHTAQVVNLYTREFYELAERRLRPGGLLCQWANIRLMPLDEQRMLLATFLDVFPHGTVWMPLESPDYVLLIGGRQPLRIDFTAFKQRCEQGPVGHDLREVVGVDGPVPLLACFKLGPDEARRFCGDAPVLTDDHTRVDFTTPRSLDANFGLMNAFSGLRLTLHGGVALESSRAYFADKLDVIRRSVRTVEPLLTNFPTPKDAAMVRENLWQRAQWFQERIGRRIERIRTSPDPVVSF